MNFKPLTFALCAVVALSPTYLPLSQVRASWLKRRNVSGGNCQRPSRLRPPGFLNLRFRTVVPTSERTSQVWKYSFSAPSAAWKTKNFNDAKWRNGRGGFGTRGTPRIGQLGTIWNTRDIWLRRTFNPGKLSAAQIARIGLRYYHDDAVEIYINGAPVFVAGGYTLYYENRPFFPLASRIIPNAPNVIAVHCRQFGGGQYIDVGLQEIIILP